MFNSLSGKITGKCPGRVFLQTAGIEWDVSVPDTALDLLPRVGEEARIFTWMQHTESAMTLFGFATREDRELFFSLNRVDGVGPKSALKILGSISREQLISALDSGNLAVLEKIPGLGKKTAQKMLLALKGKLALDDDSPSSPRRSGEYADVAQALSAMGYDRKAAEGAVAKVLENLRKDGKFAGRDQKEREDAVFRAAILELSQ